ncbi:hypothetical protein MMC06_006472, partial [Schaereria dolodes]|nr:hypothetical protein [Schaereria dolodes]
MASSPQPDLTQALLPHSPQADSFAQATIALFPVLRIARPISGPTDPNCVSETAQYFPAGFYGIDWASAAAALLVFPE